MNEWKQEIKWNTVSKFVDLDTGEVLTEKEAKQKYVIINKKKATHVYKTTGTITYTNECRTSRQLKIW